MPVFPDLSNLSSNSTIGNLFALPNNSYPFYWLWIMSALWLIIAFTLYFKEKERKVSGNMLSSMAVSSFAILVLSAIGTFGVGFISLQIMLYILIFNLLIIGIWIFSN